MRAFAAGAAIFLLGACQSILGIGDTTLREGDGPAPDAPLAFDAPVTADAPLTADAPGASDARVDAVPADATSADAGPPMRACGSIAVAMNHGITTAPLVAYMMTDDFTIEAWVRPTAVPVGDFGLVAGNAPASGVGSYGLYIDESGIPFFSITNPGSGGTVTMAKAADALPLDVWSHLAATYRKSNGQMLLYVNGIARANAAVSSPPKPDSAHGLTMGNFAGYLDEVRLTMGIAYTDAFSPPRFVPAAGTDVAHFHFDEVDGTVAIDVSPNANHAHLSSSTFSTVCQYYRCGSVNAFGGRVQAENVPALQPAGSFTLEAFIRPEILGGAGADAINVIDRAADPAQLSYHLFIDTLSATPGFEVSCDGQNWITARSSTALALHTWSHLAGIYDPDAGRLVLYQDGVVAGSGTIAGTDCHSHVFDGGQPLRVASVYGGFAAFRGYVDEVRLSSTARYTKSFDDSIFQMPGVVFPNDEPASLALYHFDEQGDVLAVNSGSDDNPAALLVTPTNIGFEPGCF